jgi:predicted nucleic acid-binding protein
MGRLDYFDPVVDASHGPNAGFIAPAMSNTDDLLVPSLALFEVFKRDLQQRGEDEALQAVAVMQQGRTVGLDSRIALEAARISRERGLPLADSAIYATAQVHGAVLWTQDADFEDLAGIRYRRKKP